MVFLRLTRQIWGGFMSRLPNLGAVLCHNYRIWGRFYVTITEFETVLSRLPNVTFITQLNFTGV